MDELHSGELTEQGMRRLGVRRIETDHEPDPDEKPVSVDRLRSMGRRAARIVNIANTLSPPPPERITGE